MEIWAAAFIVIAGVALLVQAIMLIALFVAVRRTAVRVEQVVGSVDSKLAPILIRLNVLVEDLSPRITSMASDVSEATALMKGQAVKIDRVMSEALERLRMQLVHVDQILTGAVETVEAAGSQLRQTIIGPVFKAAALIRGVQAGVDFLRARRGRGSVDSDNDHPRETQDEGMFI